LPLCRSEVLQPAAAGSRAAIDLIAYIFLLALSGLVIGALARLLLIGPDPMSVLETMLAGIGGSLIAGLVAYYVFDRDTGPGLLLSVLCAMGIVYAARKYRRRAAPPRGAQPFGLGQGNVHTRVYFFPGCLVFSLLASIILTVLLNLIVRAL
jgi:uncharacterized membrane protein YeaQ/YmgE (transglycosylase-associated protein family)